jgi:hypothetical protein
MQRLISELMCELPLSKEEKVPEVLFGACSHVHCVIYADDRVMHYQLLPSVSNPIR